MEPLTLVTPVFEAEVPLLHLQARSVAVHLPPTLVEQVVVLDNTRRGLRAPDALLASYGDWAAKVRILRPSDVCDLPAASGWRSQQVLKLAVAKNVHTPRYLTLDAKNHFVSSPADSFWQAPDGRARVRGYSYVDHPLRPSLEGVLTYLGLDPAPHVARFTATVTPFVLHTATARELIADVERSSGRPFAEEFLENRLTEYFLYAGWILRRFGTLDHLYELTDSPNPLVWPGKATADGVTEQISLASDLPVFGVHRDAFPRLDARARDLLAAFWAERGLVPTPAAGVALLEGMRRDHDRQRRRQQVRDLRPKASALLRRTARRLRARIRPRRTAHTPG